MATEIHIQNLHAGYGAVTVLNGVSIAVNDTETVALLGTNGNGKSTLMKSIMGLVRATQGEIHAKIDGRAKFHTSYACGRQRLLDCAR